jgi:hypothetical protein
MTQAHHRNDTEVRHDEGRVDPSRRDRRHSLDVSREDRHRLAERQSQGSDSNISRIRHIAVSLRLSLTLIGTGGFALFCLIPLIVLIYFRVLDSNGLVPTVMDLMIIAYDPSFGLPLLWFFCPIITMFVLIAVWRHKNSPQIVSKQGSTLRIWASYGCDIVVTSLIAAALLHVSLLVVGLFCIGVTSDFASPDSRFSHVLSGVTLVKFSFPYASLVSFGYCLLVLLFENAAFGTLCWMLRRQNVVFALLCVLNLPAVHGEASLVYDVMRNIVGGSIHFSNPLFYPYGVASIAYETWLPGVSHNLWFLMLAVFLLFSIGTLPSKRRDHY